MGLVEGKRVKRTVSFLLCLLLLLSLAPATALAGEGDALLPGMYTSYDENTGTASGKIEPDGQVFVIPESANGAAYYVCEAGTDVGFGNGLGGDNANSDVSGEYAVYKLYPYYGYYSHGELRVGSGENAEIYYVQFTDQSPIAPPMDGGKMYADAAYTQELEYCSLNRILGEQNHAYWGYVVPESANGVAYFKCNDGWSCEQQVQPDNRVSLNVEALDGSVYKITPGEAYGNRGSFRLSNSAGGGTDVTVIFEGYSLEQPEPPATETISPAHPVTDAERAEALAEDDYGPVSFTLGGNTYYMGIVNPGDNQPITTMAIGGDMSHSSDFIAYVGFWTLDSSGYKRVQGDEENDVLNALGSDIHIEFYAESDSCTTFPAELSTTVNDGLAARKWHFSGLDNVGSWQVRAVWHTSDGDITSYVRFSWELKGTLESEPLSRVEDVNAWLAESFSRYGEDVNYWVYLAPGEFTGYISIPNGMSYSIIGAGVDKTTLKGGLYVGPGGHGGIHGLTMVGAGSQHKSWPQLYFNGEKAPNYGIYGSHSTAAFYDIVFTGYDCAVCNADGFGSFGIGANGPTQTVFKDNRAGISIDASNGVGGLSTPLMGTVFANNKRAIELLSFNSDVPPSYYPSNHCSFIDNDVDVYNDSGRNYFMYGNYYYHSEPNKNGSHNYLEYTSKNPGKDKKDDRNLVADPLMMNSDFTARVYDDTAIPNSGEPGEFSTPASALPGRNIMVVDVAKDKDTPLLDFNFPMSASSSSGAPALLRARAASSTEPSFDPTVEYERSDDEIVITIKDIPGGLRPTVTVYCDDWDYARVSFGGTVLPSSFADESISFTATEGGTYVITRAARPVNVPETNGITVTQPENGSIKVNPSNGSAGTLITVTATPDAGYELAYVTVDGEKISGITFIMPNRAVTVSAVLVPTAFPFNDVTEGQWFYEYVAYVYANGLMNGVSAVSFEPNAEMTRAMLWTILARIDGETITGANWQSAARAWAVAEGVSDGTDPNAPVTREQFVTMLWRYAGEPESSFSLDSFTDNASISGWAETAMAWAVECGIITGVTGTTLAPHGSATRAQCAAMLMRFVEA